jgi:hypothetical protein
MRASNSRRTVKKRGKGDADPSMHAARCRAVGPALSEEDRAGGMSADRMASAFAGRFAAMAIAAVRAPQAAVQAKAGCWRNRRAVYYSCVALGA